MYLQPCDWREYDHQFKYVVDVYGRTHEGDVARVRITDFKPFFYLRALPSETAAQVASVDAHRVRRQRFVVQLLQGRRERLPAQTHRIRAIARSDP